MLWIVTDTKRFWSMVIGSTDEDGNADSSLEGVNNTLGLDIDDSAVITA